VNGTRKEKGKEKEKRKEKGRRKEGRMEQMMKRSFVTFDFINFFLFFDQEF